VDDLPPVEQEYGESVVRVERGEVLVAAALDERDDADAFREHVALGRPPPLVHPPQLRPQQPARGRRRLRRELRLEDRADRVDVSIHVPPPGLSRTCPGDAAPVTFL
jgi:hypothetical protein